MSDRNSVRKCKCDESNDAKILFLRWMDGLRNFFFFSHFFKRRQPFGTACFLPVHLLPSEKRKVFAPWGLNYLLFWVDHIWQRRQEHFDRVSVFASITISLVYLINFDFILASVTKHAYKTAISGQISEGTGHHVHTHECFLYKIHRVHWSLNWKQWLWPFGYNMVV